MSVITVLDCLSQEPGVQIAAVKGKIKQLRDRKSGTGKRGPWSLQAGVLADGQNEIDFVAWNHAELKPLKGSNVLLTAGQDKDGDPADLAIELNSSDDPRFNGKPQIKIERRATISKAGVAQSAPDNNYNPDLEEGTPPQQRNDPAGDPPQPPIEKSGPMTLSDIDADTKRLVIKLANLRVLSERAADYVIRTYQENADEPSSARMFEDEAVREIATSIFIQMCREDGHHKMPGKKLTPLPPKQISPPPEPPKPRQPTQPAEPPPDV